MTYAFDAFVTAAVFDKSGRAAFALGDGTVRFVREDGFVTVEAHDGAVLSAAAHPSGNGLITGGDDGAVVWSRLEGEEVAATRLAQIKGRWIDALAASPASGLVAFAAGREMRVLDTADPAFERIFTHDKSVADIAFDPKGRRIAAATYNGAALWFARIADQKPAFLKWAGSHVLVAFSPDGRFLMSSMQENQLHGWRLSDSKDLRMGGYPAKVKSLSFLDKGSMLATSGSNGAVIWPFGGPNGPMGKDAAEVGYDQAAMVVRVAGAADRAICAGGLEDGRVWVLELKTGRRVDIRASKGASISALAITPDGGKVAWGDEDGEAGVADTGLTG